MKANELMIMDWVANPINGKPMRVMSLTRDVELGLSGFYDEVDPIPLTAEILEKNGFNETFWGGEWTNDNVDFILIEHNDGFRMINTNIVLSGVHHFQHALRLCNIEKKIEI